MLRFRRIAIKNFVCFDDILIAPSVDPERRLTIVRAENGSGKTTFLRAIRWGMYGERGLPGKVGQFSLHPAWWQPSDSGVVTQVELEFETDGSTRYTRGARATPIRVYHLVRSVNTIGSVATRNDEPDFRRVNERTQLMVKEGSGRWVPHTAGVEAVVEELLPWGLRDFFVMDADEAADFVGGSENKVVRRRDVIAKTTKAVDSLLGIEVFRDASDRVTKLARQFGAQATKAIGDADLDSLQKELDELRTERDNLAATISDQRSRMAEMEDQRRTCNEELARELKGIGALEELRVRLVENRRRRAEVRKRRNTSLAQLGGCLESTALLGALIGSNLSAAHELLRPLYETGHIPLRHLGFVREVLGSRTCICGRDLARGGAARRHVEDLIAESASREGRANYLGEMYEAIQALRGHVGSEDWAKSTAECRSELVELDKELSELRLEERAIDGKLDSVDEDRIHVIRDEIDTLTTQIDNLSRSLGVGEGKLPSLDKKIVSLEKTLHQRHRRERVAADKRAAEAMARLVVEVLGRAYGRIRTTQVVELSDRMNRLFAQMAANVSDDDIENWQRDKATLKMIANVGLQAVEGKPEDYEIYALNQRGRAMPPIEINGASRRVLALAFVLALCIESRTRAPLVADSLLNFMSGAVRRNTLRVTAENSSQPILLLTGGDLEAHSEVSTVEQYAGATYTLTGQWDAIDAGDGGDVVRWTARRQISLVCICGPREYCDICERLGQAESSRWERRVEGTGRVGK